MENAETILVIILSSFLAIFLLLGIILLVKSIQISNRVNRLVTKAESISEFIEQAGSNFATGRFISGLVQTFRRGDSSKKGKG